MTEQEHELKVASRYRFIDLPEVNEILANYGVPRKGKKKPLPVKNRRVKHALFGGVAGCQTALAKEITRSLDYIVQNYDPRCICEENLQMQKEYGRYER